MVLAVALSALTAGCSDHVESQSDPDAEPLGLGKEVTLPISAAQATVVSPGAQPRAQLRRTFTTGASQQVTLHTEHHIVQQIDNRGARDFSPPAVTIPLTARTDPDGIDLTLGNATSSDPSLAQELQSADGSHAGFEVSSLGAITAVRLAPTASTPDAARAALEGAFYQAVCQSIVFPTEPVGVGAVWTVHQEVTGTVPLDQVTTATMTKRVGNLLTIELDVTQTPKGAMWNLPNEADSIDILDYLMHGVGTITVDLGLPLPVSGTVTIGGRQSYRDPHSDITLAQNITTQIRWGE
jgi:hypothetical protein